MLGSWMESEIREQPDLLAKNAPSYLGQLSKMVGGQEFELVLLAARGSSDNAALFARYLIEVHLGIPVSLAAPSVLTRYGTRVKYPKTLAIGISQSGAAPDVAEVLGQLREDGHTTLAITNTASSRLEQTAEHTLLLNCGEERSVAATKTYSSSLLALYQLVRALGGNLPEAGGDDLPCSDWLDECRRGAEMNLGKVLRTNVHFALARGYSFCTANETALKLMECALIACKSYSTADFQHGPRALASYGCTAIVYGEPMQDLATQGALLVEAPIAPCPEPLKPLGEIFFGQWLALLAARARGLDPDHPDHIQKVTQTR
ncbi:MAG TPA: SIS domain-containing protein [Fimbriimonadaceae bacterium]|mgnify:CR=1 FL=1|nr:SIS domain-containing protein [Fimbriimonadaceae bacterium]